ncbi:MAG TPA: DUF1786 family protein, partial [Thermodesulfobacteriota bacterium]|nr:DUF1786 family protein [Thermodesulfobacteriota bacterium]
KSMVDRFPKNLLPDDEIFRDGGHGSALHPDCRGKRKRPFVAVIGPRRSLAEGLGYYFAAPYGNMMLAGCFGLVAAFKSRFATEGTEITEK